MRVFGFILAALVLTAASLGGFAAFAWRSPLASIARPQPESFAAADVKHGAVLARLGNCAGCHSAPGQAAYAGGVPIETPFGVVHATNITPDPGEGIGLWSETAFIRAMREGVDRDGRHLYPAFPYDHFTRVTDRDDHDLYAFLMTRIAARAPRPSNTLPFPLNVRMIMAGWKALFFQPGAQQSDPTRDAAWNRGAYLVEGLGHCGACHTPHNTLGAERSQAAFAGGQASGWAAYALNAASPAPIPWTVDAMAFYLGHGWQEHHGVSRGPMATVTTNLAGVPESDLAAIGTYLVGLMDVPSEERRSRARALLDAEIPPTQAASAGTQAATPAGDTTNGGRIFATACAACHAGNRPVPFGGLDLAKSTATHAPDPTNIIIVTLNGLPAAPGEPSAIMPGFRGALDDGQILDLLTYLRGSVAHAAPWPNLAALVHDVRNRAVTLQVSEGTSAAPAAQVRVAP